MRRRVSLTRLRRASHRQRLREVIHRVADRRSQAPQAKLKIVDLASRSAGRDPTTRGWSHVQAPYAWWVADLYPRPSRDRPSQKQPLARKRRFPIPAAQDGLILRVMTHTDPTTWCLALQLKLMAALDATWTILETSNDPVVLRRARDKAKACGEIAAMARKVALITPQARGPKPPGASLTDAVAAHLHAGQAVADVRATLLGDAADRMETSGLAATPIAAQVEHARRALDKLKGGRRGRI